MNKIEAFDIWFEEYFSNQQGEDSPYTYNDVLEAFKRGWALGKNIKKGYKGKKAKWHKLN